LLGLYVVHFGNAGRNFREQARRLSAYAFGLGKLIIRNTRLDSEHYQLRAECHYGEN
jgi:hypothetical protein